MTRNVHIATVLRERLAGLRFGELLGTEVALSKEFGVARMTTR